MPDETVRPVSVVRADTERAVIEKLILDEAPVWEEQFDGGPGIVCSVSDAAVVVARWLAARDG